MSGICVLKRFLRKEGIFSDFKAELKGPAGNCNWQCIAHKLKRKEHLYDLFNWVFRWARLTKFNGSSMNMKWNRYIRKYF